jgi:hypothetical protein
MSKCDLCGSGEAEWEVRVPYSSFPVGELPLRHSLRPLKLGELNCSVCCSCNRKRMNMRFGVLYLSPILWPIVFILHGVNPILSAVGGISTGVFVLLLRLHQESNDTTGVVDCARRVFERSRAQLSIQHGRQPWELVPVVADIECKRVHAA